MEGLRVLLARSLALILVALACASPAAAVQAVADRNAAPVSASGGQLRAFWVDAFGDGLYTQAQIDQLVADVKAANLNAIVAQVVRRGDCFCNRSSLPRTSAAGVAPAPFDPLQSLIGAAHAQGIQVHAWIITTGIWQGPALPTDPTHAFNQHGPSAAGAANWIDYRSDGASNLNNEYFIDPGHPDAAAYIVNAATSIARSYNVDGINLDRIRYPDGNLATNLPSWGYNPTAIARFQAATGRTDRPAASDAAWTQWRRDQVTNIIRKIYLETYAIRPGIRISADTITYGSGPQSVGGWTKTRTYAEPLQDWVGWLREGILDLNIAMNDKRDADANQRSWYLQWADFAKDSQFQRSGAIGSALYLNDIPSSIRQARTAVAASSAGAPSGGWVGYSYRTPDAATDAGTRTGASARAELIDALTKPSLDDPVVPPIFASAAPVPGMPWKEQPAFGQLRGIAVDTTGSPIAQATVTLADASNNAVAQRTTDGAGWFGFVDVPTGTYRVTIDSSRAAAASGSVTVAAGQIASVAPAPPAARRGRAVDGGLRRVLAGDRPLATDVAPLHRDKRGSGPDDADPDERRRTGPVDRRHRCPVEREERRSRDPVRRVEYGRELFDEVRDHRDRRHEHDRDARPPADEGVPDRTEREHDREHQQGRDREAVRRHVDGERLGGEVHAHGADRGDDRRGNEQGEDPLEDDASARCPCRERDLEAALGVVGGPGVHLRDGED